MRPKFKMPTIKPYHGQTDLREHLETYVMMMQLHGAPNQILCRAFPTTRKGTAREWYHQLTPGTIRNFDELAKLFVTHFGGCRRTKRSPDYLKIVRQGLKEGLQNYFQQFKEEAPKLDELTEKDTVKYVFEGLQDNKLAYSLAKNTLSIMAEVLQRAQKYIQAEEKMALKHAAGSIQARRP